MPQGFALSSRGYIMHTYDLESRNICSALRVTDVIIDKSGLILDIEWTFAVCIPTFR